MKKSFAVFTALILLFLCAVPAAAAEKAAAADFTPVIRFVAASDTHVKSGDPTNAQRIRKMVSLAYEIAAADHAYTGLDAVLVAGDLTNDGTEDEFRIFWDAMGGSLRDGTRFLGVVAKNHDGYEMKRAALRAFYTSLTGNDADFHSVINGYHFIGVSASPNDGIHYSAAQLKWLREQLDAATAEAPDRPVFVTHHEHVRGTVYGSSLYDGWGVTNFTTLLNKYPQVVDFSGHSHYPLNDPRSVWQGKFTAVGTGAIYYSEFTIDEMRAYHPADSNDTATCWIVELNKENDMRLRGYDVNEGKLLCERILKNPADPANRDYTPAKRKAAAAVPAFDANAALTVTPEFGGCTLTAPAAASADGEPVVLYRAYAKNGMGVTVAKERALPCYYRAVAQETVSLTLTGLAEGEYTVCVVAENAYGAQSEPLCAKVTVAGENGFVNFFLRIAQAIKDLIDYLRQLFY